MAKKTKTASYSETKQVGKFGLIGILNTLIDFGIYNLMIFGVGLAVIPANLVSTTSAMIFSFTANKTFVFHDQGRIRLRQVLLFVTITAFSLYILQNSVIYSLLNLWQWPLEFGYFIVELLQLDGFFTREFVFNNGAKAIGSAFSMTWNYLMYKKVVFKR